jgi:hypothetical protein
MNHSGRHWLRNCGSATDPHHSLFFFVNVLQEEFAMRESFKKALAQELRLSYRDTTRRVLTGTRKLEQDLAVLPEVLPEYMQTGADEVSAAAGRLGFLRGNLVFIRKLRFFGLRRLSSYTYFLYLKRLIGFSSHSRILSFILRRPGGASRVHAAVHTDVG